MAPDRAEDGSWRRRGPPSNPINSAYNSWLYCPLLHAATGDMPDSVVAHWHAAASWWTPARQRLAAAPPIPAPQLHTALLDSTSAGAPALVARLTAATQSLPRGTELHLGWVVRTLQDPDGYIAAAGQETLLQLYGGLRFAAELAAQADTFRRASHPHPARRARAPRRGGRGRGGTVNPRANTPAPAQPPSAAVPALASPLEPSAAAIAAGLASLDAVDLLETFRHRVYTFQHPPRPLQGILAFAFRKGLQALLSSQPSDIQCERGWKLFLLGPRMLLHRPCGNAQVPTAELRRRAASFQAGRWLQLLEEAAQAATLQAQPAATPAGTASHVEPSTAARCTRAVAVAHQGELSAASHALTSDPLADSTLATLQALRDRPARPVHPIPAAHLTEPGPGHALSAELFITNLQRARRGAAPGPSGCTNAHLRVLLNSEDDLSLLHRAAQQLVDATVPPPILDALRLGRMVALRKGDGRVRGLVLGDTFRRLLSRTLAQTFGAAFDAACAPHQFALSTRAGAEALTRAVRARLSRQHRRHWRLRPRLAGRDPRRPAP